MSHSDMTRELRYVARLDEARTIRNTRAKQWAEATWKGTETSPHKSQQSTQHKAKSKSTSETESESESHSSSQTATQQEQENEQDHEPEQEHAQEHEQEQEQDEEYRAHSGSESDEPPSSPLLDMDVFSGAGACRDMV